MKSISLKNQVFSGAGNRPSLYDITIPEDWNGKLVIFIHGYMGFKDWGCWNLVQDFFNDQHFGFLKYNVSHNGCTVDNPVDFVDLEAFSFNTYSKEIEDFERILDVVFTHVPDNTEVFIIGHSRGGGVALLLSQNERVKKIASWAGIASIAKRFPTGDELTKWKEEKYRYTTNGRTGQKMPHHIEQFYDFEEHRDRLDIESYCKANKKAVYVVHGADDTSVDIDEGRMLASWLSIDLLIIPDTAHTFGASHPWKKLELPEPLRVVCDYTLTFFDADFENEEDEKHSMLSDLIKLAKADNELRDIEFQFLHSIARQMGVTTDDFKELFEKYIEFNPPKLEVDRIVQFQRLVLLMNVDEETDQEEINYIKNLGIKMGLHPRATDEVLRIMNDYPNKVVPPEKLISIFKTFHN